MRNRLADVVDGTRVLLGGAVIHRQRPAAAGGIAFFSLEDETPVPLLQAGPAAYQQFLDSWYHGYMEPIFTAVQPKNGTVTIPAQIRRQFGLDQPGAQVEIVVRDNEIVLVPHVAIPADERWFWTPEWQAMEREADADLATGRRQQFDSAKNFLAHLDTLSEDDSENTDAS